MGLSSKILAKDLETWDLKGGAIFWSCYGEETLDVLYESTNQACILLGVSI